MSIVLDDLTARLDTLTKAVLSQPLARIGCSRVTIRPLSLRGKAFFQLEYQQGQKVTATVEGTVQSRDGGAYVLAFTTAGGSHRLHYPKPARGKSFAVGDTVTLYYDPDDPEKMYVEGDRATLGAEVLYAVIGVALLVLTVGIAR